QTPARMRLRELDLDRFPRAIGAWLSEPGPLGDVVVSCRTRLARNLAAYPFVNRLNDRQAHEIADRLRACFAEHPLEGGDTTWVDLSNSDDVERLLLRERHLVSRDHAPVEAPKPILPGRAVVFSAAETTAAMVNEEDHLRLQGFAAGFDLERAWERVRALDRQVESQVELAASERLGYLTACPTNVGTGLRASVMLHLPSLGLARTELEKVFNAAQRTGLVVRGMYGEGSRAGGDLYQVSNQITLGRSEADLVGDLAALVPCVVEFERRVRATLVEEHGGELRDRVVYSLGFLRTTQPLETGTALMHLSRLRLGVALGWVSEVTQSAVDALFVHVQRGHVQALGDPARHGRLLTEKERDALRARLLRRSFGGEEGP
ncbi:MAG TPA: hypothetical protein VJP77_06665, partial [Planctomycetota bacterium]|nr:hypothetical protein [Planctomycetota bacterium]